MSVDPVVDQIDATLKPYQTEVPEKQKMLGTVVDEDGKPIVGAVVWISGAKQGDRKWWGQVKQVERVSVTDQKGKFLLTGEVPFDEWELTVRASGYCQNKTEHQPTGSKSYEIKLKAGVLFSGTVVSKDDKPVPEHIVGILQRDRTGLQNWIGEQTIATDKNGLFTFTAVLPEVEWVIYSAIDGKPDVEFIQSEFFDSGKNNSVRNLGKFEIKGSGKLSGRISLPPGELLPKEIRVGIERKYAWRSQVATIKPDGTFQFPNLPLNEPLAIYVIAKGFQLDESNQTLQQSQDNRLGIFLDKEKTEIEIPMIKASK